MTLTATLTMEAGSIVYSTGKTTCLINFKLGVRPVFNVLEACFVFYDFRSKTKVTGH